MGDGVVVHDLVDGLKVGGGVGALGGHG
jgi:hypothetical protein